MFLITWKHTQTQICAHKCTHLWQLPHYALHCRYLQGRAN